MQIVVNILILASLYALIGCGYVLVYRASRVLNLAHGELMMLGAYVLLTCGWSIGAHPFVAICLSLSVCLAIGSLLYWVLMKRLVGEQLLAAVLTTIALGILLRGVVVLIWTAQLQYPAQALGFANVPLRFGGAGVLSKAGLLTVVCAVGVYFGLAVFLQSTRWGLRLRAVGENPLLAAQRGIRLDGVMAIAWGLAVLTGGLAGMLLALDSGLDTSMAVIGFKAFPAVLVGGLDSLRGAWLGAMAVATVEVLAIQFITPLVSDVAPFILLIVMLLVRPWGLFGTQEELERV